MIAPGMKKLWLLLIIGAATLACMAQDPETTFKADVKLVNVFVTVTDAHGGPVSTLQKENFVLKEDGKEQKIDVSHVDVSMNGIELQDREFFKAIAEHREPNASVAQVLPCYRTLADLERQLNAQG